jgi:hypothetical protein
MKNFKIKLVTVKSSDQQGLTKVQAQINQWITVGLLVKYEIHTANEDCVFNICLRKEASK